MLFVAVFAGVVPALASAAGGGASHGEQNAPGGAQWFTLLFTAINFSIFAYLLWRFARAPLSDYLANRRAELVAALSAARDAKAEADRIKHEYETKLAEVDKTRAEMVQELRAMAEADRARAMQEAGDAAARMREEAERTARHDVERAKMELRAEAARLAAEIASGEIAERLSDDDRGRLLDDFIEGATKQ
jgi:F-type H+-transporting ATPase subunit b